MEYEFIHDSLTGLASARFSMEHEIMGPWLEVEVGNNLVKLDALLDVAENAKERMQRDIIIKGLEYSLLFGEDFVKILSNGDFEHHGKLEMIEVEENLHTDFDSSAECGIDDFKELLMQWSRFIK